MIHIDELFRQRMEDREASPKPGAWSNMRGLLDKEMPVAATGTNWRRAFGYFTGLLLLASASMGGYSLYTSQLDENVGTAPFALRAANTGFAPGGNSEVQAGAADEAAMLHEPNSIVSGTSAAAGNPGTAAGTTGSGTRAGASAKNAGAQGSTIASTTPNTTARVGSGSATASSIYPSANDALISGTERAQRGNAATGARLASEAQSGAPKTGPIGNSNSVTVASNSSAEQAPVPRETNTEKLFAAATASSGASATKTRASSQSGKHEAEALAFASGASGTSQPPVAPVIRRFDTVQRIEIVTRYRSMPGTRRTIANLDTLPMEAIVVERLFMEPQQVAATEKSARSGRKSADRERPASKEPLLASAATPKSAKAADPAAIASSTAASGKDATTTANEIAGKLSGNRMNFWQSLRLDERVEKAKMGLQSIQLYPGIIAGINASPLTPNALGGFQLGVTSLIAINEWWSVLGELKYMHRFNTGSSVRDDYMKVTDVSMTPVTLFDKDYINYQWKEARVSHYFNYETVQTIELPVALRYNNNRFFTQGGVNFVSNRAIAAREVTNVSTEVRSTSTSIPASSNQSPLPQSEARVGMADFGNRFGIGYLLGAGYSFTPSVYVDFRMTHTFWDNSASAGARQISKDLLRTPSFQLSVGYRFGVAKERP